MVLEAPLITESALEVIRKYCEDEVRAGGWQSSLCPQHRGAGKACGGGGPVVGPRGTEPGPCGRGSVGAVANASKARVPSQRPTAVG